MIPLPPRSTLFPYTTLFRSMGDRHQVVLQVAGGELPHLCAGRAGQPVAGGDVPDAVGRDHQILDRSEEHTSELQSPVHLVCRLLLEKKKKTNANRNTR